MTDSDQPQCADCGTTVGLQWCEWDDVDEDGKPIEGGVWLCRSCATT